MDTRWNYVVVLTTLCFELVPGFTPTTPVLNDDMYNISVLESTPIGTVVFRLQESYPGDLPVSPTLIRYTLAGTDMFSIDPFTGNIIVEKPLDREEHETIQFLVYREDDDLTNAQIFAKPVTVTVFDVNDTPPTFKKRRFEIYVKEDVQVGAIVLEDIEVEDEDLTGDVLRVGCERIDQSPDACRTFAVIGMNASRRFYSGMLMVKKPLDYHRRQFYRYQMYADDGIFKSKAHIMIKVEDVQNRPPEFRGPLTKTLPEDAPVGTLALILRARDSDTVELREIYYELVHNPHDFFTLDGITGQLRTTRPLNRDVLKNPSQPIELVVRASEIVDGTVVVSETTSTLANVSIIIASVEDGTIDSATVPVRYRILGDSRLPHFHY